MKALTIRQPWLHCILTEGKDIENRSWTPGDVGGWIALHAAGSPRRNVSLPRGVKMPDLKALDYSAICAVARVSKVVTKSRSKWFDQPEEGCTTYRWVLTDVTALPRPIPCTGRLMLWEVAPADLRKIKRQLPHIDFGK